MGLFGRTRRTSIEYAKNRLDEARRARLPPLPITPKSVEEMMADIEIHSFAHCKACVLGGQTPRIEAGLSRTGVVIQCTKHGLVVHFSPEELAQQLARGAQCDCCPGGMHRS